MLCVIVSDTAASAVSFSFEVKYRFFFVLTSSWTNVRLWLTWLRFRSWAITFWQSFRGSDFLNITVISKDSSLISYNCRRNAGAFCKKKQSSVCWFRDRLFVDIFSNIKRRRRRLEVPFFFSCFFFRCMHALLRRIPCTRGLWALFLERSDVYELHHRTSIVLLGPPQWGIKREKKSFRSIDPLSRIPRTACTWFDTERDTRAALST